LIALVVLNAIALAAVFLVRRWAARNRIAGSPAISAWATAVGALCAVLFGFTIVNLWNVLRSADANVDAEAVAVRMVARDLQPAQTGMLRDYVAATVVEWPSLCGGGHSPLADAALARLEQNSKAKSAIYDDDLYRQLSTLEDLRLVHLRAAGDVLPRELWIALGVLAVSLLVVLAFALLESQAYHIALMLAVGTALGMLFWVASLLDYPFCGSTSVQPTALVQTLQLLGR